MTYEEWIKEQIDSLNDTQDEFRYGMLKAFELCLEKYCLEKYGDTVPFDFDLYQAGLMGMPDEMIKVLDEIRAEIESKEMIETTTEPQFYNMALNDVLQIIDKYRAESEE